MDHNNLAKSLTCMGYNSYSYKKCIQGFAANSFTVYVYGEKSLWAPVN